MNTILLYIFVVALIAVGMTHFTHTRFYTKIVPPKLPFPKQIVILTGIMEISFALLLLIESIRSYIAWLLILFFIAVYPANIYMWYRKDIFKNRTATTLRLPFQFLFIYWAWLYT